MKNVDTGTIKTNRLNSSDKLEDVSIDRRAMSFLYDGSGHGKGPYVFMDQETFDQKDDIADQENPVEGERRRVRCVRCGKEYTEVVNYYWYGSP